MKKVNIKFRNIIVLGLGAFYMSCVAYMTLWDTLSYILFFPLLLMMFFYVLYKFTNQGAISIPCEDSVSFSSKQFYLLVFFIIFAGQLLYWFAFYPGGFNLDAYGQWDQVHGLMKLNNWHPVFTTGCYWLLTRIVDSFAFCIFVQLIAFSLSIAYLLLVLYRLKIPRTLLLFAAVYISINPAIGMNNVCLFKDVPFTITLIWTTVILLRIIVSNGTWLKSPLHLLYLSVNLIVLSLIRHNAVFITIPLIICLFLVYWRFFKEILSTLLIYSLLFIVIEGPLFSALSIEQHSNVAGEAVGIPMAIMTNNFITAPEDTPSEVKNFLLSIASEDDWNKYYELGEWDSCKWEFGGIELFQGESLKKFARLTLLSLKASPETAYQSFRENTRVVWQIFGAAEWDTWVYIEENEYGISYKPNTACLNVVEHIRTISTTPIGSLFSWNVGLPNALLVCLALIVFIRKEYSTLALILPFICYNLLTMLLLCGPSHRYFYFNSVLFLPIILFGLRKKEMNNSQKGNVT